MHTEPSETGKLSAVVPIQGDEQTQSQIEPFTQVGPAH